MSGRPTAVSKAKTRDPERSREAILAAAEELFAERGFDGVSVGEIAATAGLSRGAPNYFFGSKAELYGAVLERAFRDREQATRKAFRPLVEWASLPGGASIRAPLTAAVEGYLDFLLRRPTFSKLIQREELASAARLRDVPRESKAIAEAFATVRAIADARGLDRFSVDDAVLVFVSLTFYPANQRATFMAALGRDLTKPATRKRHVELVVDQVLHLMGA